jgi:hypothetical protein
LGRPDALADSVRTEFGASARPQPVAPPSHFFIPPVLT